jgi:hypothetical protein
MRMREGRVAPGRHTLALLRLAASRRGLLQHVQGHRQRVHGPEVKIVAGNVSEFVGVMIVEIGGRE